MAWTHGSFNLVAQSSDPAISPLLGPLEDLLVSGGDGRLGLSLPLRENTYGCAPFPRPDLIDFASSTASTISVEAYERASAARGMLLNSALRLGLDQAFDAAVAVTSTALLSCLKLTGTDTKVVFAPSGTDAQLSALFLARALLAKPVTSIVVGADQTGSGTVYTSTGRHFSRTTAGGWKVDRGGRIDGLGDDAHSIEVKFSHSDGTFRSATEMDEAVLRAVDDAVAQNRSVLLQAMEASKFGWRAPSDEVLGQIATRYAGRVQIVVDACQSRITRSRLRALLAKGYCVLITGSKFFTGPAFSGALLVPGSLSAEIATLDTAPAGLFSYSSGHDWPAGWHGLRRCFPRRPNFGQWLRWEAALEEMRLYYAVPKKFRDALKDNFRHKLETEISRSSCLELLPAGNALQPSIFGVILKSGRMLLSQDVVTNIYRTLRYGVFATCPALRRCQLGQPVVLPALETAALRLSLSARLIRQCWSENPDEASRKCAALFESVSLAVEQLDGLARQAGNTDRSLRRA